MVIDDLLIATLPIKPQNKTNIGMMLAPTIMDYIGTALDIEKNLGVNILHSYADKGVELNEYLEYINNSGIKYNSLFIDSDYSNQLLEIIEEMYNKGELKIKNKVKLRCSCGRVDMINSLHNNGKLYNKRNGKLFCNYCGGECHMYNEKSLVFELKSKDINISIVPTFLKKEISFLKNTFDSSDIMISKNRDTGYKLKTKEGIFNIDIDFLWMNYFKLFDKTNIIYIASNHQLFSMFVMNCLAQTTSIKNLIFIANPYINVDLEKAKEQYEFRKLDEYKKMLLLYNLKWKNKNCDWCDSNYRFLANISDTKVKNLYNSMIISAHEICDSDLPIDEMLYRILNQSTNMQENIKIMKKLYKTGNLKR